MPVHVPGVTEQEVASDEVRDRVTAVLYGMKTGPLEPLALMSTVGVTGR